MNGVLFLFSAGLVDGIVWIVVNMVVAAIVSGPLATIMRDAWLVTWMVELDDIRRRGRRGRSRGGFRTGGFCEEVAALGLAACWDVVERRSYLSFLALFVRGFGTATLTSRVRLCSMIGCMIDALIGR